MEWARNMLPWALPTIAVLPMLTFGFMLPWSQSTRSKLRWSSIVVSGVTMALSFVAFAATLPGGNEERVYHAFWPIAVIGREPVGFGVQLNGKVALMLLVVTIVGFCVQVYSEAYMHREKRIGWYYAVLSLFTGAMLALVLSDNYLQLFMAWEIMGLCSYLLIGFWYEDEAPRIASMKAFMTTRVGDIGLTLGIAMIWTLAGSFSYDAVFARVGAWPGALVTVTALLLFLGAMGKSAQFPLHVWLPDAMAGPTPASALIHAATMVAAGVWLVIVSAPIFKLSPTAMTTVLVIGGITTLVGGVLALVQHDVKKVLAYSTISQLGMMFLAIGGGAWDAAFFHLVTHAFFKAPLFLAAGVIIHASHTQDMREMNGLARAIPWTTAVFTVCTLALVGIPPLSGFFSKDEILAGVLVNGRPVAFAVGLVAAVLTAFYMSRLWFRIFPGVNRDPEVREGHAAMVWPPVVLAAITVLLGFLTPWLSNYLVGSWEGIVWGVAITAVSAALLGIGGGWWVYGRRDAQGRRVMSTEPYKHNYVYSALVNKLYIDTAYEYLVVRPYIALCEWLARVFDPIVVDGVVNGAATGWKSFSDAAADWDGSFLDAAVNGVGVLVQRTGAQMRRIQVGKVQVYQRLILAALLVLILWAVLRGA